MPKFKVLAPQEVLSPRILDPAEDLYTCDNLCDAVVELHGSLPDVVHDEGGPLLVPAPGQEALSEPRLDLY